MATEDHLDLLIKQLDLLEKDIVVYHQYSDKFYDVWSRLTSKGQGFRLLEEYRSYGKFLLNYTFKTSEKEEVTETKIGDMTCRVVRKPLEGCIDIDSKVAGISFCLFRLDEEYPNQKEKAFIIPRHKSITDDKKAEMQIWKEKIFTTLDKIKKRLDRLQPVITCVAKTLTK